MLRRLLTIRIPSVWLAALLFSAGWPATGQNLPVLPPPPPDGRQFTIKADVDLVLLDVSVRDSDGGHVSGLTKDNFTVFEDGRLETITQFAARDIPVTLGLVMDSSGSMRAKRPEVVTAALVLIQASNPLDEVFVVNFNDTVRRGLPDMVPFTDDIPMLRAALDMENPRGRTRLYDAILAALDQLEMGRRDKKTLVVVSDGGDNASTHTMKEVVDAALASRATIYTVGIYDLDDPDRNPDVLKKLASLTGGVCYLPKAATEAANICRDIAKDIRMRYTIGYVPQNVSIPGIRHVKVEARNANGHKLHARTRTEYVVDTAVADRKKR